MAKRKASKATRVAPVFKEEIKQEEAEVTAKEAQAVVDELQADQDVKNISQAEDIAKMQEHDPDLPIQRPASESALLDFTHIPEYVYVGGEKRYLKDSEKCYRWGRHPAHAHGKLEIHMMRGWRPVQYSPKFDNTGLFFKTPENWVKNGDTILLEISRSGMERLKAEKAKRYEQLTAAVRDDFMNEGARRGVNVFEEKDGKQEFN